MACRRFAFILCDPLSGVMGAAPLGQFSALPIYSGMELRMNLLRSAFSRVSDGRWMYIMCPASYVPVLMFFRSDSCKPR